MDELPRVTVRLHDGSRSQEEEIVDRTPATLTPLLFVYREHIHADRSRKRWFKGAYRRRGESLDYDLDLGVPDPEAGT